MFCRHIFIPVVSWKLITPLLLKAFCKLRIITTLNHLVNKLFLTCRNILEPIVEEQHMRWAKNIIWWLFIIPFSLIRICFMCQSKDTRILTIFCYKMFSSKLFNRNNINTCHILLQSVVAEAMVYVVSVTIAT